MRFKDFSLTRYGHFTEHNLDFGSSENADFHLIYGPNEAGKSTTLSAILDFLFDYPKRNSPYVFKHDYSSLELGATLEFENDSLALNRTRQKLSDTSGQLVSSELLVPDGMSRENFELRFCFDGQSLQEGGESILRQQGDLGSSLFSATTGLSDFSDRINTAMKFSTEFYEPGRKKKDKILEDLKERYISRKEELSAIDTTSAQYKKITSSLEVQQQEYDELSKLLKNTERNLADTTARLNSLAISKRINSAKDELHKLDKVIDAPKEWIRESKELHTQIGVFETHLAGQSKQIGELEKRFKNNKVDSKILKFAQEIKQLSYASSSELDRFKILESSKTATTEHRAQLEILENQIQLEANINSAVHVLSESTLTDLQTNLDELSRHDVSLQHATTELDILLKENEAIDLPEEPEAKDTDRAKFLLDQITSNSYTQELKLLENQQRHKNVELDVLRSKLAPFSGDLKNLSSAITAVEECTTKHLDRYRKLIQEIAVLKQAEVSQKTSIKQKELDIQELNSRIDGSTHEQQSGTRKERDNLWTKHIELIQSNAAVEKLLDSADLFYKSMSELDRKVDVQLEHSDVISQIHQLTNDINQANVQLGELRSELAEKEQQLSASVNSVNHVLADHGFSKSVDIERLEIWLNHAHSTLKDEQSLATITTDINSIKEDITKKRQQLIEVMSKLAHSKNFEETVELDELVLRCVTIINSIDEEQKMFKSSCEAADLRKRKITHRENEKLNISNQIERWKEKIRLITKDTWLADVTPSVVRALLPKLRSFNIKSQELQRTTSELKAAQSLSDQYQEKLANLNRQLLDSDIIDRNYSIDEIQALLNKTEIKHQEYVQTQNQIGELKKSVKESSNQLIPAKTSLSAMFTHFSVEQFDQLEEKLETLEKQQQLSSNLKRDLDVLENSGVDPKNIKSVSHDELQLEIDSLQSQQENNLEKLTEAYSVLQDTKTALRGIGDNEKITELTSELANLKLQIVEGASSALQARLGQLATNHAIQIYRDQHRSSMMEQASKAFTHMTAGKYKSLKSRPGPKPDTEELIGIDRDGNSKTAADMSDGTRSQLYLSLKVAAYHEYCKSKTPWPFIADDVMEKFDNDRAAAALQLFSDMGKKGQVLYLTHHEHLVDIARNTLGDSVNIIEL